MDTAADMKSSAFAPFHVESLASKLEIRVEQGTVRLFGLTAEKSAPGLVHDSLGLNGYLDHCALTACSTRLIGPNN